MKFVWVNGRTPCPQSYCAQYCTPIGASYLREIATRLSYCNHNCYVDRCKIAKPALHNHTPGRSECLHATDQKNFELP
jgi:hypothetical protein